MNMNPPPAAGNKKLPSPQGAQKQAEAFGLVQFPSALIQSPDLGVFLQVYEGNAQFFLLIFHREMMNFTMGFGGTKLGSPVFSQRQDLALWSTV